MIDVIIVVSFVKLPIYEVPSVAKVSPIAKVMKISIIKAMVEVAKENKRREAHVKR